MCRAIGPLARPAPGVTAAVRLFPTLPRIVAPKSGHLHRDCHAEGRPETAATSGRPVQALARRCDLLGLPRARDAIAEQGPGCRMPPPSRVRRTPSERESQ
jgi:hypothetical protein